MGRADAHGYGVSRLESMLVTVVATSMADELSLAAFKHGMRRDANTETNLKHQESSQDSQVGEA